ncbi:MAG: hypothetical protein JNK15_20085, partial [Planctomycetes bacterium]|nr:hypothetical protein [Planctomycetota bacterium]
MLASTVQVVAFVATAVAVLAWSTDDYASEQVRAAATEARARFAQQRDEVARTWVAATVEYARSPRLLATAAIPDVDDATFAEVLAELQAPIVAVLDPAGRVVGSRGGWRPGTQLGTAPGCAAAVAGTAGDHVWPHPAGPAFVAVVPLVQGDELLGALVRGQPIDATFAARIPVLAGYDHVLAFGPMVLAQHWRSTADAIDLQPLLDLATGPTSERTRDLTLRLDGTDHPGLALPLHADGGMVFLAQDLRGIYAH